MCRAWLELFVASEGVFAGRFARHTTENNAILGKKNPQENNTQKNYLVSGDVSKIMGHDKNPRKKKKMFTIRSWFLLFFGGVLDVYNIL